MSEHTAGPWRANFHHTHRDGGRTYAMVDDGKSIVPLAAVTLGVEGCSEDEGRANARLIAAAPDLLAAWQAFMDYRTMVFGAEMSGKLNSIPSGRIDEILDAASAAIAKATGTP